MPLWLKDFQNTLYNFCSRWIFWGMTSFSSFLSSSRDGGICSTDCSGAFSLIYRWKNIVKCSQYWIQSIRKFPKVYWWCYSNIYLSSSRQLKSPKSILFCGHFLGLCFLDFQRRLSSCFVSNLPERLLSWGWGSLLLLCLAQFPPSSGQVYSERHLLF